MIDVAAIDACLASTATEWGTTRYAAWHTCEQLYDLRYSKGVTPRERPDYFALGSLIHAAIAYLGLGVLASDAGPRGWRDALDRFVEVGGDPMLSLEASLLLEPYFAWWGEPNAGYGDARIVAVELPVAILAGPLQRTTQLDAVIEYEGELVVVNHKTRSSALPRDIEDFKRSLRTDPQFLLECFAASQHFDTIASSTSCSIVEPMPLMINYLIKTREPSFQRVIVRPTRDDIGAWYDNACLEALDIDRDTYLAGADVARRDRRVPRRNYSACAPWGRSQRCEYFEWCHGTDESRALHYERIER